VPPGDNGTGRDRPQHGGLSLRVAFLGDFLSQIEVVPANDRVFDEPFTGLGDLLFLPVSLEDFASLTDRDFTREGF